MEVIKNWGIVALLGSLVCAAPMVVAAAFVYRPSDRLLALMRPLSLAAVFTAISNTMLGFVNSLHYISLRPAPVSVNVIAAQMAETILVPFVAFGCLAVAWLFVAVGMRKQV